MKFTALDYRDRSTPLCEIAKLHDTDKCSIRKHGSRGEMDPGHSHPYSIFYHDFLNTRALESLNVAEIGILNGASLKMWRDYLPNSTVSGFDNCPKYLNLAREIPGVKVDAMDIRSTDSINMGLAEHGPFDLIIEDTTHLFDDQIRFINQAYKHLKPGGHLIIEDIFKVSDFRTGQSHAPEEYENNIDPVVFTAFKDVYLVHLDHDNCRSTGWNNDGLLVFESKKAVQF